MSHITDELREVHRELAEYAGRFTQPEVEQPLAALEEAALDAGKAWSGSWLGYQSRVYHADLQPGRRRGRVRERDNHPCSDLRRL